MAIQTGDVASWKAIPSLRIWHSYLQFLFNDRNFVKSLLTPKLELENMATDRNICLIEELFTFTGPEAKNLPNKSASTWPSELAMVSHEKSFLHLDWDSYLQFLFSDRNLVKSLLTPKLELENMLTDRKYLLNFRVFFI